MGMRSPVVITKTAESADDFCAKNRSSTVFIKKPMMPVSYRYHRLLFFGREKDACKLCFITFIRAVS